MIDPAWAALAPGIVIVIAALGLGACAPRASDPRAAEPPIASVWRARCGACHARIEPGEKSHAEFVAAMKRHQKRVRLTAKEWDALVAWLARDDYRSR